MKRAGGVGRTSCLAAAVVQKAAERDRLVVVELLGADAESRDILGELAARFEARVLLLQLRERGPGRGHGQVAARGHRTRARARSEFRLQSLGVLNLGLKLRGCRRDCQW